MYGGVERKFFDDTIVDSGFSASDWTILNTSAVVPMNAIIQGDGESQYDGRYYDITSMVANWQVHRNGAESQATPLSDIHLTVAFVLDTMPNGVVPIATDVFTSPTTFINLGHREPQFIERYKILKRYNITINARQVNEGAVNLFAWGRLNTRQYKCVYKFKPPLRVFKTGTDAAITSYQTNTIWVMGFASDVSCELDCVTRFKFLP